MGTDAVIRLGELYAAHTGLKISTVSSYAANDGKWLTALQRGSSGCTVRRLANVVGWFADNWPADLAWPSDIPRPGTPREAA